MNWTAADVIAYLRRTGQPIPEWLENAKEPKASKYHNEPATIDGIRFDSRREARRWCELRLLEQAGEITELKRQMPFRLAGGIKYVADFTYMDHGQLVIEDVKGVRTAVYRIKKRLMKEAGYEIKEV